MAKNLVLQHIRKKMIRTFRDQKINSQLNYTSNPPTARIPSTKRLYSRNSSPTSERRRSSGVHSINRVFGGAKRNCNGDDIGWDGALEAPTPKLATGVF